MHFNLAICLVHVMVAVPSGLRVIGVYCTTLFDWKISHLSPQVQAKMQSLCGQHFDLFDITRWSRVNVRDLKEENDNVVLEISRSTCIYYKMFSLGRSDNCALKKHFLVAAFLLVNKINAVTNLQIPDILIRYTCHDILYA